MENKERECVRERERERDLLSQLDVKTVAKEVD